MMPVVTCAKGTVPKELGDWSETLSETSSENSPSWNSPRTLFIERQSFSAKYSISKDTGGVSSVELKDIKNNNNNIDLIFTTLKKAFVARS